MLIKSFQRFMCFSRSIILKALAGLIAVACSSSSAKRRAESVSCGNYMVSIGYAALVWANDQELDHFPFDLLSMSNELITPRILVCPGDRLRQPAASWASFTPAESSYEVVTPGLRIRDTNGVFLRCKVHGYLGYADATVFDGVKRRSKVFPK